MRRYRFYMITLMVIGILFSVATMTVNGQGEHDIAMERAYYDELEDAYTLQLKEVLLVKGYVNAGITITKVYGEGGSREYTVQIHHRMIDGLSDNEKVLLQNELANINFGDERCQILHKFLIYED